MIHSMRNATLSWFVVIIAASMGLLGAPYVEAQTPCQSHSGADLVGTGMIGPANYAGDGVLEAFSFGTEITNVGTAPATIVQNTNQHAIMGQALYRLKHVGGATRFEEVGQSWMFHTFLVLNNGGVCACTSQNDGVHLGSGCTDSETASITGTQSALGPRWQVNAHTGNFAYPPANPSYSGSVARRLQVEITDLENTTSSTTRYFAEQHFVAPDDAAAGWRDNNATHREIGVSGSGTAWTFGTLGIVQRERPAIFAWQDADPSVTVVDVRVPSEGLFVLAYAVTDLGNGTWHYEYALENLNSDLSARSFDVPLASGVQTSNVEFHDVAYHDGDGVNDATTDGTDWNAMQSGGALSWSTATFAQNPNANALRWGTTYNFRFDADAPPMIGTIAIGIFKPGGATSVTASAPIPNQPAPLAYCFGDGLDPLVTTACPCGNFGGAGHGCANSVDAQGALLGASGSTNPDTIRLTATGMPAAVASIFLAGNGDIASGTIFGDGVRCVGGSLIRLGQANGVGGTSFYPSGAQPPISVRANTPPGSGLTGYYQTYYRNSAVTFCPPATFNVTNGVKITW